MNMRTPPSGAEFSHHPATPGPIVDQIVLFTGREDGLTTTSIEKVVGVQAASAGTSAYWLDPLNDAAPFESPTSRPAAPSVGLPTYVPFMKPRWSTSVPDVSSKRQ